MKFKVFGKWDLARYDFEKFIYSPEFRMLGLIANHTTWRVINGNNIMAWVVVENEMDLHKIKGVNVEDYYIHDSVPTNLGIDDRLEARKRNENC